MNRRTLIGGGLAASLRTPAEAAPARPNIILMMADDMGWGDPGFNGNRIIRTPHLDEMAKAGIRFTEFYAGGPVCSPTRASDVPSLAVTISATASRTRTKACCRSRRSRWRGC